MDPQLTFRPLAHHTLYDMVHTAAAKADAHYTLSTGKSDPRVERVTFQTDGIASGYHAKMAFTAQGHESKLFPDYGERVGFFSAQIDVQRSERWITEENMDQLISLFGKHPVVAATMESRNGETYGITMFCNRGSEYVVSHVPEKLTEFEKSQLVKLSQLFGFEHHLVEGQVAIPSQQNRDWGRYKNEKIWEVFAWLYGQEPNGDSFDHTFAVGQKTMDMFRFRQRFTFRFQGDAENDHSQIGKNENFRRGFFLEGRDEVYREGFPPMKERIERIHETLDGVFQPNLQKHTFDVATYHPMANGSDDVLELANQGGPGCSLTRRE